jgi:hypothetical protein
MSKSAVDTPPPPPTIPTEEPVAGPLGSENSNAGVLQTEADIHCLSDVLPGANPANADAAQVARREWMLSSWDNVKYGGWRVFLFMQGIGEIMASVLGLNHSKYQWVIDNMSEEDWKIAKEVNARREAQLANQPINDMEGATGSDAAVKETVTEAAVER